MNRREIQSRLFKRIIARIRSEERLLALRRRTILFSLSFGTSLFVFLGLCILLRSTLINSELLYALSLVFSDSGAVLANWYEFTMFVLELVPALSLAGILSAFLLFLLSAGYAFRYLAKIISLMKYTRIHFYES